MEKKIMLFGPPGVGKSTIIKHLAEDDHFNQIVCDLEDYQPGERMNVLDMGFQIMGSADLNPKTVNRIDLVWVALIMPQREYEARREQRDLDNPGKASQPKMLIESFLPGTDYVIDATRSLDEIMDAIEVISWNEDITLHTESDDSDTDMDDECDDGYYRDDPCGYGWDDDGNYMGPDECDPDSPNFDY